jgi:hypothetical protein
MLSLIKVDIGVQKLTQVDTGSQNFHFTKQRKCAKKGHDIQGMPVLVQELS